MLVLVADMSLNAIPGTPRPKPLGVRNGCGAYADGWLGCNDHGISGIVIRCGCDHARPAIFGVVLCGAGASAGERRLFPLANGSSCSGRSGKTRPNAMQAVFLR